MVNVSSHSNILHVHFCSGYDVVAYPLTEYSYIEEKYNLDGFIPKPSTALTEVTTIEVSIPEEPVHIPQIEGNSVMR